MSIGSLVAVVVRRLRLQVRSVTWWGASALMAVVFAAAAYRSVRLFDVDRATFEADQARHADDAGRFPQTYSQLSLSIDRAPVPLRLFLRGNEDAFAACVTTYGRFRPTEFRGRDTRSSTPSAFLLDPAMVVGLLGSLLALIIASSTVVREREEGTLQLVLTYPCRRSTLLLGEHLATVLTVAAPMVGCTLAFVLFAAVSDRLQLDGTILLALAQFLALCVLLASVFAALGLLIATMSRRPATAVTAAFAVWVVLAFAYPLAVPSVIGLVRPVAPSPASLAAADTLAEYDLTPPQGTDAAGTGEDADELRGHVSQAGLQDSLAALSPYSLFILGVETSTGTGTDACRAFLETVQTAAAQFRRWQDDVIARYPGRATMYNSADPPLDTAGLPPNQVASSSRAGRVVIVALLLLVWNGLFTVATQIRFARYDARV
jgi:ABC-type transport system involved in multi-copper enzyme maturation permease subunit